MPLLATKMNNKYTQKLTPNMNSFVFDGLCLVLTCTQGVQAMVQPQLTSLEMSGDAFHPRVLPSLRVRYHLLSMTLLTLLFENLVS